MRTHQLKPRGRMIELADVLPRLERMTRKAPWRLSISSLLLHTRGELPTMRITMTSCAGEICKPVKRNIARSSILLVAVSTGHSDVCA